jgi:predicted nucleotidyltransferase
MAKERTSVSEHSYQRWYRGKDIPIRVIRQFAREVGELFHPEKIILFGSYAYGTPHDDSDVDILVVIPARRPLTMAARIENTLDPPFPLDLIVRTPEEMRWRLREQESFLTEVTTRGKLLYEKDDAGMGTKGRRRLSRSPKAQPRKRPPA